VEEGRKGKLLGDTFGVSLPQGRGQLGAGRAALEVFE